MSEYVVVVSYQSGLNGGHECGKHCFANSALEAVEQTMGAVRQYDNDAVNIQLVNVKKVR